MDALAVDSRCVNKSQLDQAVKATHERIRNYVVGAETLERDKIEHVVDWAFLELSETINALAGLPSLRPPPRGR